MISAGGDATPSQSTSARTLLFPSFVVVAHGNPAGKVKLGDDATPAEVIEHLRKEAGEGGGGVSDELEALMSTPLEVTVNKSVRKTTVTAGEGKASFEVTGVLWGCCPCGLILTLCWSPLTTVQPSTTMF